jgi:hypothetical protein
MKSMAGETDNEGGLEKVIVKKQEQEKTQRE